MQQKVVGWRHSGNWQRYLQLQFNLQAPTGHLPAARFIKQEMISHRLGCNTGAETHTMLRRKFLNQL